MKHLLFTLWLVATGVARADTVSLKSGEQLKGMVIAYGNSSFEVRAADGQVKRVDVGTIKRIDFDARPAPTILQTRAQGKVESKLTTYEDGMFNMQSSGGGSMGLSADMVTSADLAYRSPTASATGAPVKKIDVITHGDAVNIGRHVVPGKITIVDFYADWCGPCRQLAPFLEDKVRNDPDLVMRKIDIVNWDTAVAKQFGVQSIPRIQVYGRHGEMVGVTSNNPDQINQLVAKAKSGGR